MERLTPSSLVTELAAWCWRALGRLAGTANLVRAVAASVACLGLKARLLLWFSINSVREIAEELEFP
jgi:hypothetical protein